MRILCICIMVLLISSSSLSGYSDTLVKASGETLTGTFQGFDNGTFRFVTNGETEELPVTDVASVNVAQEAESGEAAVTATEIQTLRSDVAVVNENVSTIIQRLDNVDAQLIRLSQNQAAQTQNFSRRIYELNPVSRLQVTDDRGEYLRNGNYRLTGRVRNESSITIRYPRVRIDLLTSNGTVVQSRTIGTTTSAVGPGSDAPFRTEFENPPAFQQYRITPVIDYSEPPRQGGGYDSYPPLRLEDRE